MTSPTPNSEKLMVKLTKNNQVVSEVLLDKEKSRGGESRRHIQILYIISTISFGKNIYGQFAIFDWLIE